MIEPLALCCGHARTVFLNIVWMQIGGSLAGEVDPIRNLIGTFGSVEVKCSAAGFTRSEKEMADVEKSLVRRAVKIGPRTACRRTVILLESLLSLVRF